MFAYSQVDPGISGNDAQPVLVTGGAGYIGSHSCKALARQGLLPITYDNLSTGHRDAVRWGPFVEGDVLDTEKLKRAIADAGATAVVHFAACAYVGESIADPGKYYRNNVAGTVSLLQACRDCGVKALVVSSSCAVYGIPSRLPVDEASPLVPISPYGRSKLMMEQIVVDHAAAHGLRHMALRYFNVAGADPEGALAERHDPETHLIPLALQAANGTIDALSVLGSDYDTPDGTCIRDYIHVTDLAWAHAKALRYLLAGGHSVALNLGSGRPHSVAEIVDAIHRVTGCKVPTRRQARRPGDPPALHADSDLARKLLGFEPRHSDIDTIIRTAARSFMTRVDADRQVGAHV
jgi:UDP-arabinose 4-epimerase